MGEIVVVSEPLSRCCSMAGFASEMTEEGCILALGNAFLLRLKDPWRVMLFALAVRIGVVQTSSNLVSTDLQRVWY